MRMKRIKNLILKNLREITRNDGGFLEEGEKLFGYARVLAEDYLTLCEHLKSPKGDIP